MLLVQEPWQKSQLLDSTTDVHVCNEKQLVYEYIKMPTRIGRSMSEGFLLNKSKIRLRFAKMNNDRAILNLKYIYYLPSSASNLVSLVFLNDHRIYHNNTEEKLYERSSRRIPASAQRQRKSFVLKLLNLSDVVTNFSQAHGNVYQGLIV